VRVANGGPCETWTEMGIGAERGAGEKRVRKNLGVPIGGMKGVRSRERK